MDSHSKKVIGISNWYFLNKMFILSSGCLILFMMFYIILMDSELSYSNKYLPFTLSAILPILTFIYFTINNILYWNYSGIYVNDGGDHVVYIAGFQSKEDKLLNGTIIANQVTRGLFEQLLGIATMTIGVFENRPIHGVRYKDIKTYDDLMRSSNPTGAVSMF